MIATINNWVSRVVGTVKAPLSAIAPEIATKKTPKADSDDRKPRKRPAKRAKTASRRK